MFNKQRAVPPLVPSTPAFPTCPFRNSTVFGCPLWDDVPGGPLRRVRAGRQESGPSTPRPVQSILAHPVTCPPTFLTTDVITFSGTGPSFRTHEPFPFHHTVMIGPPHVVLSERSPLLDAVFAVLAKYYCASRTRSF